MNRCKTVRACHNDKTVEYKNREKYLSRFDDAVPIACCVAAIAAAAAAADSL